MAGGQEISTELKRMDKIYVQRRNILPGLLWVRKYTNCVYYVSGNTANIK